MNKYLTKKLAEEGAEVAQAACKVLLHGKRSRKALIREMADQHTMILLAHKTLSDEEKGLFLKTMQARIKKEERRGKAGK